MEHTFRNSGKLWTRRDSLGPVEVTERDKMFGPYPDHCVIWDGPHILTDGERVFETDRSIVHDCGKYGVNLSWQDIRPPRTPEQEASYWARLAAMVRNVFPGYELAIPDGVAIPK